MLIFAICFLKQNLLYNLGACKPFISLAHRYNIKFYTRLKSESWKIVFLEVITYVPIAHVLLLIANKIKTRWCLPDKYDNFELNTIRGYHRVVCICYFLILFSSTERVIHTFARRNFFRSYSRIEIITTRIREIINLK